MILPFIIILCSQLTNLRQSILVRRFARFASGLISYKNELTKTVTFCCMKNVNVRRMLTWKQSVPTSHKITPYVSMVDTDQEKEALSILSAKSRNHSVEEKRRRKIKKEKGKRKEEKRKLEKWICLAWTCNDRGLGPRSEPGPRLDKRGSPRGLLQSVSCQLVVVGSLWLLASEWSSLVPV